MTNGKLNPNKVGAKVTCTVCGRTKAPVGRSVADAMAGSVCDVDCEGYDKKPRSGSLWPDESEADFGFPVGEVGVRYTEPES